MKVFLCDACGSLVFFENVKCLKCGHTLGFLPAQGRLGALEPAADGTWRAVTPNQGEQRFRLCENARQHQVCNWLVPANDPNQFCVSCRLNELIPNLAQPGNLERWHKLEMAKRQLIYTLLQLGLPMAAAEKRPALRFKFLGQLEDGSIPLTGHANGLITVNIAEADDPERERYRINLHEPYRTLLGHLRHEIAHYYWDRLVANSQWLPQFRELFGDETTNYAAALKRYYEQGPPPDWQSRHVSAYASSHPWEDWAETGAHYFHIIDMVETAGSFGMTLKPPQRGAKSVTADPGQVCGGDTNFGAILENWFPLTHALNSLNRGMGFLDVYPFVLSGQTIEKLRFIHEVVHAVGGRAVAPAS